MDVPRNALSLLKRCKTLYRIWWAMHYAIGLIGILSAALLTAVSHSEVKEVDGLLIGIAVFTRMRGCLG